jgi:hypothetical protein
VDGEQEVRCRVRDGLDRHDRVLRFVFADGGHVAAGDDDDGRFVYAADG